MPNNQKPGQGNQPKKTNQPQPKGADRGKGARHDEDEEETMKTRTKDAESGDDARQAPGAGGDDADRNAQGGRGRENDVNSPRRDK